MLAVLIVNSGCDDPVARQPNPPADQWLKEDVSRFSNAPGRIKAETIQDVGGGLQFETDDGKTWSNPENWTKQLKDPKWHLFAPAPGNGITLENGTLVMPTAGRDAKGLPFSNLMWSKDHGESWTLASAARTNTNECAVAELSDGSLMLNMRDNRNRPKNP